jgi:hypothetical protein
MVMKIPEATLLAVVAIIGWHRVAQPAVPDLEQRVEDLEKEVRVLRERLDRAGHARPRPAHAAPNEEVDGPPPAKRPLKWDKVRLGMTQIQVTQLVGEPQTRTGDRHGERWSFPDGGQVDFDPVGEVVGWSAPR